MNVNLVLFKKNGSRKGFSLPGSVTVVGRRTDCDFCIPLMVVSRKHCELNLDQGQLKIRDLGSRNGTFVNDQQIDEAPVSPGDRIRIGPVTFAVQIDGEPVDIFSENMKILGQSEKSKRTQEKTAKQAHEFADLDDVDSLHDFSQTEMFKGLEN